MKLNLRLFLFFLVGLVAFGALFQANKPTGTSNATTKKVTLVIDFGEDSKREPSILELTDLASGATGWDALERSGLNAEGTKQFPTGFLCRLDGWPTASEQDCLDTPTYKEGHWAYFISSTKFGSGWMLSGQGAATHIPECGAYEGWKWVGSGETTTPPKIEPKLQPCNG